MRGISAHFHRPLSARACALRWLEKYCWKMSLPICASDDGQTVTSSTVMEAATDYESLYDDADTESRKFVSARFPLLCSLPCHLPVEGCLVTQ